MLLYSKEFGFFHLEHYTRIKKIFRNCESLNTHVNFSSVWRFILGIGVVHFSCSVVKRDETHIFLNIFNDWVYILAFYFEPFNMQKFIQKLSQVITANLAFKDSIVNRKTLVYRYYLCNTMTRLANNTSGLTIGLKWQNSLVRDVHAWDIKCFEHDLCHLFTTILRRLCGLGQEDGMLIWGNSELYIESVVP